jgi:hypothetical protein
MSRICSVMLIEYHQVLSFVSLILIALQLYLLNSLNLFYNRSHIKQLNLKHCQLMYYFKQPSIVLGEWYYYLKIQNQVVILSFQHN